MEFTVGAIACYPKATYCARMTVRDGGFVGDYNPTRFETTAPEDAFATAAAFFGAEPLKALTISLYGIVDAENRNFLGSTQENWTDEFDLVAACGDMIKQDIVSSDAIVCCDDNSAGAVAEHLWGAGQNTSPTANASRADTVYFKVLDGIGSGVIVSGSLWNQAYQPEMGHLPARRFRGKDSRYSRPDNYAGSCPKHYDCIEGLASRAALTARLPYYQLESLADLEKDKNSDHDLWHLEAYYLAQLAVTANMILAPRRIIFEGDFITPALIDLIKQNFKEQIADYPRHSADLADQLIFESSFNGADASILGALELARQKATRPEADRSSGFGGSVDPEQAVLSKEFKSIIENARNSRRTPELRRRIRQDLPTQHASIHRKVFALSITETVQWGIADAIDGILVDGPTREVDRPIREGTFPTIPETKMPIKNAAPIQLQAAIKEALLLLYEEQPDIFAGINGIGVSTVGIVDPENRTLESIARKNWVGVAGSSRLVDFKELLLKDEELRKLFPNITKLEQVVVQNDAPARCLTEYHAYKSNDAARVGEGRPRNLMYLMVGEGVNGAIVRDGELPHMLGHPELGHQFPIPHHLDLGWKCDPPFDEDEHTGCPSHYRCFEGVASAARIRLQWGKDLWELPGDHIAWGIEAFYLSQMAMNAVLTLDPDRIIFGGQLFHGRSGDLLLELVRSEFIQLNAGYLPKYRRKTRVEALIGKAQFETEIKVRSALTMGCVGAFSSDRVTRERSNQQTAEIIDFTERAKRPK